MLEIGGKIRVWMIVVLQLAHKIVGGVDYPCRFTIRNENSFWFQDDGRLRFPDYIQESEGERSRNRGEGIIPIFAGDKTNFSVSCNIENMTEDVLCKDSIDFDFLYKLPKRRIKTFVVESYNLNKTRKKSDKIMNFSKKYFGHKLMGELIMKDIRAELNTIVDLREIAWNIFLLQGEVFSNKIIKMGWKYNGKFVLNAKGNNIWDGRVKSVEFENGWKINGNIEFSREGRCGHFRGNISYNDGITPSVRFKGGFYISSQGDVPNFSGDLEAIDINLNGSFSGRKMNFMTSEITIPKRAFANMTIENFLFKNSYFSGDFHTRSFEGIDRLRVIKFLKSKMEFMPEYDKFFIGSSLKAIYIENCNTLAFRTGIINNCTVKNLQLLSFKGSGFLELYNNSFFWLSCSNLTFLNFHDTNIKLIGDGPIFSPVGNTLKYLDLSYSTLRQESIIRQLLSQTKLTHLSLAGLQLKRVPIAALQAVKFTLTHLSLRKNNFEKIPGENMLVQILNFPMMPELRILDLGECHINYIESGVFDMLTNLETLDLSRNNIVNLHDGWIEKRPPGVLHLNLSYNVLAPHPTAFNLLDVGESFDLSYFKRLQTLDLSNTDLSNGERFVLSMRINLRYLSLCKCGLKNLNDSVFEAMPNIEEIDLSGNPSLGKNISLIKFKYLKLLKKLHLAHNGIGNLTFNQVRDGVRWNNLEYIDLTNNYIKDVSPKFFQPIPNLKILKLSRNSISYWPRNLTAYLPRLTSIFLDNNKLETISSDTMIDFSSLEKITLGNNAYVCGRFVLDFLGLVRKSDSGYYLCQKFVKRVVGRGGYPINFTGINGMKSIPYNNKKNTVGIYFFKAGCALINDWSTNEYLCYSPTLRGLVPFVNVDENFEECQVITDPEYFDSLSLIVTGTSLFCFFLGFLWWKWWNFRIFARMIKSAAVLSFADVAGESEIITYEYDAFVSYTDSDRPWVTEKLIPTLEKLNDVKICLHERDFQVGLSILENIAKSIDKSKSIMLVLSQAFVKSQWCQYEMHLAYHRLLERRRDHMILILLENIPRNMRPNTLRYLMMTTTYLQWPKKRATGIQNNNDEEIFWNRLFKSLQKIN